MTHPEEILPGQLWLDDCGVWDVYDGEMLYVTCSKEPGEDWVCMRFQEWEYGAQRRDFTEDEIRKLKFIGNLSDLKPRK